MASNTIKKVVSVTVFTAPEVSNCTTQVISSVFQDCPRPSSLTVLAKLAECTTSSFEPQSFSASVVPCGQCRVGAALFPRSHTCSKALELKGMVQTTNFKFHPKLGHISWQYSQQQAQPRQWIKGIYVSQHSHFTDNQLKHHIFTKHAKCTEWIQRIWKNLQNHKQLSDSLLVLHNNLVFWSLFILRQHLT